MLTSVRAETDVFFSSPRPSPPFPLGYVGFVSNLQKPYLPQQFALFCWVHMSLLVIVVSSHFIVNNILEVRPHLGPPSRVQPPADAVLMACPGSGHDLVLLPRVPRRLQRRLGLPLWYVRASPTVWRGSGLTSPSFLLTGMTWGKTPLFKLSPKKTVEGFVGGLICTLIFGVAVCPLHHSPAATTYESSLILSSSMRSLVGDVLHAV